MHQKCQSIQNAEAGHMSLYIQVEEEEAQIAGKQS